MVEQKKLLGADFGQRVLTALIGGPMVLLMVFIGRPVFDLAVVAVAMICAYELQHMFRHNHRAGLGVTLFTIGACITALIFNAPQLILLSTALFIVVGAVETLLMAADKPKLPFFIRYYFLLLIGALYIGIPLGLLTLIRASGDGLLWTIVLFINNWATDSFALIGGRIAGRHKLAPKISPAKTVEGALIGLTIGFLLGFLIAVGGGIPVWQAALFNVLIALAVEAGDLLESWAKRRLSVKDSGHILPGHGGFLDRVDGTLLASIVLFLLLARLN